MRTVFKTTGGKDPVKDASTHYAAGDVIFQQGDLGTDMFIIQEGEVNIVKHINGESHTLSHLEKGDFFGEMAVLESVPRTADAIAATEVRALAINGAATTIISSCSIICALNSRSPSQCKGEVIASPRTSHPAQKAATCGTCTP